MRFFDKKMDASKKFSKELELQLQNNLNEDQDNENNHMNPFSLDNFQDTTGVQYPDAKGDMKDVYTFVKNIGNVGNANANVDSHANTTTSTTNNTTHNTTHNSATCCVIL